MANCMNCNRECRPNQYRIDLIDTELRKIKDVDICSEECAQELINKYIIPHADAIYEMLEQPIKRLK